MAQDPFKRLLLENAFAAKKKIKWKLKNGVFWDVTSCDSCKSQRFGGT
jgi:hypothetical protein